MNDSTFRFDPSQQFQLDAIASVVDLFDGQPADVSTIVTTLKAQNVVESEDQLDVDFSQEVGAIGNNVVVDDDVLLANLQEVQNRQGLEVSPTLLEESRDFEIEMETGTGKTYVYLRTIFELAKRYKFTKFVILVPSVAIREGVLASIQLMRKHFAGLYPGQPFDSFVYSGKNPEAVQYFATATSLQIMILTIDSLRGDKENRIMHQPRDTMNGLAPINYLASTNPVVIMDEPQNMASKLAQVAIGELRPAFTLRYSATHKTTHHVVFRLDPVEAHELGLVKTITVSEIAETGADVTPYIKLIKVESDPWAVQVELNCRKADGSIERKTKKVVKDRALELSHKQISDNPVYAGIRLDNCRLSSEWEPASATFTNVGTLELGEVRGGANTDIYRAMIRETVMEHFSKQARLASRGIKVLSLFFVDRVASYLGEGSTNENADGDFARWFDEAYDAVRQSDPKYMELLPYSASEVRRAYFSQLKRGGKTEFRDTKGSTKEDDDSYELIMKDKARLLDPDEPVRFIFSHSALREGWDNPNVFQICTLREMGAEVERRQTIGRGLRLPVVRTENGYERISEKGVASLTVVANESYQAFASSLQKEYQDAGVEIGKIRQNEFAKILRRDDQGVITEKAFGFDWSSEVWKFLDEKGFIEQGVLTGKFRPNEINFSLGLPQKFELYEPEIIEKMGNVGIGQYVKAKSKRQARVLNTRLYSSPEFEAFWEAISQKTTYRVSFDQNELKKSISDAIREMPPVPPRRIIVTKAGIKVTRGGAQGQEIGAGKSEEISAEVPLPDLVGELQEATSLTRVTIIDALLDSGRLGEFPKNPNDFIASVKAVITRQLADIVNEGIQYEKIQGSIYELRELQQDGLEEKERFIDQLYEVQNKQKTDFDFVVFDSGVERKFAEYLDGREDISLFMKLPPKFRIPTPVGDYNPDWAIIKKVDGKDTLYLIRETKSAAEEWRLRPTEKAKIKAAAKHFEAIGVDYAKSVPSDWKV